ncbi:hypothetical protein J3D55_004292 [Chryseobacterium ginsenosidimutans]|jgi:hypothetical protein|uniref:hypothetical protein n=1 Tax=Chryseobacterium ginsenosidimutans TaxID=687846 RepID=UPI00216779DA|nr:hypothetical protein [Chryseobacterium ginsenosidimutans]MCS3871376.1 hypothetical protein [Chryseobacterium ginsenosidimutans]
MIKKLVTLGLFSISVFSFAQETETKAEPKFSIMPSVGYSWRIAKTASGLSREEKEYVKGLKNGVSFDISGFYEVKKGVSFGLKYSNYSASSDGFIMGYVNGMPVSVPVTTKDNISFYGAGVLVTNDNKPTRHKLFMEGTFGVMTYTTKTASVKGTGTTFGAELDFGYQYQVSKNFLIGPKVGLAAGVLKKMKIDGVTYDLGNDNSEGLQRVSLSAAATFRF